MTTIVYAIVDVGFGNQLFIRGSGGGFSWERGCPMENVGPDEWVIRKDVPMADFECKFLINDEIWSAGENIVIGAGEKSVVVAEF